MGVKQYFAYRGGLMMKWILMYANHLEQSLIRSKHRVSVIIIEAKNTWNGKFLLKNKAGPLESFFNADDFQKVICFHFLFLATEFKIK